VTGSIIQVNISLGGIPKRPVRQAILTPTGLEGDRCARPGIHGGPQKAVLIVAAEAVDELSARGYPLFYGALGENLTTRGLDCRWLRIGQVLRAGEALLEISSVRRPCGALDVYGPRLKGEIYDEQVKAGDSASPRWGMSGFYARVVRPGTVRCGDWISVLSTVA